MHLLLMPFLLAARLWQWAAPTIPDPGLRYLALFILPQIALNQAGSLAVSALGTTGGSTASCLAALFCCVCVPVIFFGWGVNEEEELIPEFGSKRKLPSD